MYKYTLIAFWFLLLSSGCIGDETIQGEGSIINIGDRLPTLDLILSDETHIDDKMLAGKVVMVLLFTTECPDCRKQLPIVEEIYQSFKDRNEIVLFGISRKDMNVAAYWEEHKLTFPYSAQPDLKLYNKFAHTTVPRIYITAKTGEVYAMFDDDPIPEYEVLYKIVSALIK